MSRSIPLYDYMSHCPVDLYPLQMALADLIWNPNLTMWYFLCDSLKWKKKKSSEYELPSLSLFDFSFYLPKLESPPNVERK